MAVLDSVSVQVLNAPNGKLMMSRKRVPSVKVRLAGVRAMDRVCIQFSVRVRLEFMLRLLLLQGV